MRKLMVANYKMNGDSKFYKTVQKTFKNLKVKDTEIVLCPPFVYLSILKNIGNNLNLGCQDISNDVNNKSTGQISPSMLKEFDVKYAIVGHSERREIGENNNIITKKLNVAFSNNIIPILCVGEKHGENAEEILISQLKESLNGVAYNNFIIAYEPIWAIGSGCVATNKIINSAVKIIKNSLTKLGYKNIPILYGGSVNDKNYKELLKTRIDGFLLGGISLKLKEFTQLVEGVDNE